MIDFHIHVTLRRICARSRSSTIASPTVPPVHGLLLIGRRSRRKNESSMRAGPIGVVLSLDLGTLKPASTYSGWHQQPMAAIEPDACLPAIGAETGCMTPYTVSASPINQALTIEMTAS